MILVPWRNANQKTWVRFNLPGYYSCLWIHVCGWTIVQWKSRSGFQNLEAKRSGLKLDKCTTHEFIEQIQNENLWRIRECVFFTNECDYFALLLFWRTCWARMMWKLPLGIGWRDLRLQTSSRQGFKHVESKLFVIIRAIRKKVSYFNEPFRGHPLRKQKVGHCTKDNFLPPDKRFWYIPKTRPDWLLKFRISFVFYLREIRNHCRNNELKSSFCVILSHYFSIY